MNTKNVSKFFRTSDKKYIKLTKGLAKNLPHDKSLYIQKIHTYKSKIHTST